MKHEETTEQCKLNFVTHGETTGSCIGFQNHFPFLNIIGSIVTTKDVRWVNEINQMVKQLEKEIQIQIKQMDAPETLFSPLKPNWASSAAVGTVVLFL